MLIIILIVLIYLRCRAVRAQRRHNDDVNHNGDIVGIELEEDVFDERAHSQNALIISRTLWKSI